MLEVVVLIAYQAVGFRAGVLRDAVLEDVTFGCETVDGSLVPLLAAAIVTVGLVGSSLIIVSISTAIFWAIRVSEASIVGVTILVAEIAPRTILAVVLPTIVSLTGLVAWITTLAILSTLLESVVVGALSFTMALLSTAMTLDSRARSAVVRINVHCITTVVITAPITGVVSRAIISSRVARHFCLSGLG